jgi:hypothetical protein
MFHEIWITKIRVLFLWFASGDYFEKEEVLGTEVLDGHLVFFSFEVLISLRNFACALAFSKVTGDCLDSISMPNLALS